MFIHLGGETVVRSADVVAIIEHHMDDSKSTREFLDRKEQNQQLIRISKEETKSYVVLQDKVYCSPISSLTLKKRANFVSSLESR
ncbi:MAG TPA: extracellular matrix/biofilm biosynthesis regulator RemA family protein [Bacillota bacterium]|nr:extracellular matrix/biofilm biosynthesis regulator RemA family protein [Bacillota bacterium]